MSKDGKLKDAKLVIYGHINRGNNFEFLRLAMEGKIEGKRGIDDS